MRGVVSRSRIGPPSARASATPTTAIVTTTATTVGSHVAPTKPAPPSPRCPSAMRLVQVRPRQEQGPCVRQEQAGVEESLLAASSSAGDHEHRREQHDRRVEVEDGGRRDDDQRREDVERERRRRRPCEQVPRDSEDAVGIRDHPDQQQAEDQHERLPRLDRGGACGGGVEPARKGCGGDRGTARDGAPVPTRHGHRGRHGAHGRAPRTRSRSARAPTDDLGSRSVRARSAEDLGDRFAPWPVSQWRTGRSSTRRCARHQRVAPLVRLGSFRVASAGTGSSRAPCSRCSVSRWWHCSVGRLPPRAARPARRTVRPPTHGCWRTGRAITCRCLSPSAAMSTHRRGACRRSVLLKTPRPRSVPVPNSCSPTLTCPW